MAITDQATNALASTLAPATPGGKDTYDLLIQQAFANDPDLLKKLQDPVTKRLLMGAIGDAFVKGNEKLLQDVLPGLLEKVNIAQIDLNKSDAEKRITAEAEKAKAFYDSWLERQKTQLAIEKSRTEATLEANKTGFMTYEKGAAGWAGFMRFITAIVDAFQQGSFQPIRDFVAEFSSPKDVRVSSANASAAADAPSNGYKLQNPNMPGASSTAQIAASVSSPAPLMALTGQPQQKPEPAEEKAGASLRDNADSITAPAGGAKASSKQQAPRVLIGWGAPAPEPK